MLRLKRGVKIFVLNIIDGILQSSFLNSLHEKLLLHFPALSKASVITENPLKMALRRLVANRISIGFVMDGNRRHAKSFGKRTKEGHLKGAEKLMDVMKIFKEIRCPRAAFFAFSKKNYRRTPEEVSDLIEIFEKNLDSMKNSLDTKDITQIDVKQVKIFGDILTLPEKLHSNIGHINQAGTEGKSAFILVAYSSLEEYVKTGSDGVPKIDIIIRTGGEKRLSDFLLCNASNGSMVAFLAVKWPLFTLWHLVLVVLKYRLEESLIEDKSRS